ncbi:ABC transporter permease [Amycolatopsis sp. GM8]|uniref:ABC transporter permease n=1 Tax=Amycolatopsis sp. GM8 TaxID=2896530 RepID=UPI001F179E7F|nr:ABC transporter permease [Amycolatopsis sp. GM8]
MSGDLKAELSKQVHRPASWLLLVVAVALSLTFGYLVPYAAPDPGRGQDALLPGAFVGSAIGGLPIFIGGLTLIFGVLVAGSEYGWDTWKTVLAQGSSRFSVYGAKIVTVAVGTLLLMLTLFAAAAGASALVAVLRDQPMQWPSIVDIVRGIGAGWLIAMMWGTFGVALAVVFRSVALPIGLGLVWLLAVQNLLASVAAPVLPWVAEAQKGLPGPNAGSLVAGLGARTGTPGVEQLVGAGQASLVVAVYLLAFAAVGGWLLHRRDLG